MQSGERKTAVFVLLAWQQSFVTHRDPLRVDVSVVAQQGHHVHGRPKKQEKDGKAYLPNRRPLHELGLESGVPLHGLRERGLRDTRGGFSQRPAEGGGGQGRSRTKAVAKRGKLTFRGGKCAKASLSASSPSFVSVSILL